MKKNITILILLITLGITGTLLFQSQQKNARLQDQIVKLTPGDTTQLGDQVSDCKTLDTEYTVTGNSMNPLFLDGQKLRVAEGYYQCNPSVVRDDVIIYKSSTTNGSIVKQVRVLPGDIVKFANHAMILNGETLKNSAGQAYDFAENEIKLLSAYLREGKLQEGSFFVFGDNLANSADSRKIGAVGIANFQGKVLR